MEVDRPLCECHGEPMWKNRDWWLCSVDRRAVNAVYRSSPEGQEKRAITERRRHLDGFNLTLEDFDKLMDSQDEVCWSCGKPPGKQRLHIDHDHKTGLIRGLLCYACNRTLGHIERDGKDTILRLFEYLESPPAIKVLGKRYGNTGRVGTKSWRKQTKKRVNDATARVQETNDRSDNPSVEQ